jgi:hypothetical protein
MSHVARITACCCDEVQMREEHLTAQLDQDMFIFMYRTDNSNYLVLSETEPNLVQGHQDIPYTRR